VALSLAPGESLCVAVKATPGEQTPSMVRLVARGTQQDLSLSVSVDDGGTKLSLRHPFDDALVYDLLVTPEESPNSQFPSSSCAANPGVTHVEAWEERLTRVTLSRFLRVEPRASGKCDG
jgi:hypothetical protein